MLSIRFNNKEWWVSGKILDRLFQSALKNGGPQQLEHLNDVINANGGVDLSEIKDMEIQVLISALRQTAQQDMATDDADYRQGLTKFLEVTEDAIITP